jgi:hypothetical protein
MCEGTQEVEAVSTRGRSSKSALVAPLLCSSGMTELCVQVLNDDINVSLPGSHYYVTYCKPAKSTRLVATFISDRGEPSVTMTLSEFLILACRVANDRARALGWGGACEMRSGASRAISASPRTPRGTYRL